MELLAKLSWATLALIHLAPASVSVRPGSMQSLYGVEPSGELGTLLTHRGVMFLALVVACGLAAFHPPSRLAASLAVSISVLGFLALYVAAGFPTGSLRTIAAVDLVAVGPLALVLVDAWRTYAASVPC